MEEMKMCKLFVSKQMYVCIYACNNGLTRVWGSLVFSKNTIIFTIGVRGIGVACHFSVAACIQPNLLRDTKHINRTSEPFGDLYTCIIFDFCSFNVLFVFFQQIKHINLYTYSFALEFTRNL